MTRSQVINARVIAFAIAALLWASACGSSGSGASQRSSAASSTASSAASAALHQIKLAVQQAVPSGATVTGVSMSGGKVVIRTKLPDTAQSRRFAKKACGAASAVVAGMGSLDVNGAGGRTLASC
jgi:hypothetical protein